MIRRFLATLLLFLTISLPVYAQFTFPVAHFSGGALTGQEPLGSVVGLESTVFDVSATIADSFDSAVDSQRWFNIEKTPADSSSQGTYDFFLGVDVNSSTDDPSFNGSAGSAAAFWSFDGGDWFNLENALPTFLKNLHKTTSGEDFWYVATFNRSDTSWQNRGLFGSNKSSDTSNGVFANFDNTEAVNLTQLDNADNGTEVVSDVYSTADGDQIFIVTHDHGTNTTRFWTDSTSLETRSHTFGTTTVDPDGFALAAFSSGGLSLTSETQIRSMAMGNAFIGDTEALLIMTHLGLRESKTYP